MRMYVMATVAVKAILATAIAKCMLRKLGNHKFWYSSKFDSLMALLSPSISHDNIIVIYLFSVFKILQIFIFNIIFSAKD